jgi:hypothetical protein
MPSSQNRPPLSKRTQEALERGAESPLSTALFKTFGNQWSDDNPEGVVNAGLAENSLMHECSLPHNIYQLHLDLSTLTFCPSQGYKSFGQGLAA